MAESHCPICAAELEIRDVAPCFDCGWDPGELEHLAEGKHTYTEVLAFGIPIVVRNFCLVDFSSYDPAFFNRPARTKLGLGEFVRYAQSQIHRKGKTSSVRSVVDGLRFSSSSRRSARVAQMASMGQRRGSIRLRERQHSAAMPLNSTLSAEHPFS